MKNYGEITNDMKNLLFSCEKLITDMLPGVKFIALKDYALLNDVMIELREVLKSN